MAHETSWAVGGTLELVARVPRTSLYTTYKSNHESTTGKGNVPHPQDTQQHEQANCTSACVASGGSEHQPPDVMSYMRQTTYHTENTSTYVRYHPAPRTCGTLIFTAWTRTHAVCHVLWTPGRIHIA